MTAEPGLVSPVRPVNEETAMLRGQCHCGAISYEMPEAMTHHALCHCSDCRRHAGAPMVSWGLVPADQVTIHGDPRVYSSSEHGRRHFCGACGTGLFYTNEQIFPGRLDVQTCTLDDPGAVPVQLHVQVADDVPWMDGVDDLPKFERFPG
jgi:hypothetical protein